MRVAPLYNASIVSRGQLLNWQPRRYRKIDGVVCWEGDSIFEGKVWTPIKIHTDDGIKILKEFIPEIKGEIIEEYNGFGLWKM